MPAQSRRYLIEVGRARSSHTFRGRFGNRKRNHRARNVAAERGACSRNLISRCNIFPRCIQDARNLISACALRFLYFIRCSRIRTYSLRYLIRFIVLRQKKKGKKYVLKYYVTSLYKYCEAHLTSLLLSFKILIYKNI